MICPFGILTCWLCWLICLDWGFRCRVFSCAALIYSFEILTCWLYWSILLPCLAYWLWFFHDCSDHFTCIQSPLYITQLDMLILWVVYYFDRLWAWCLYHYSSWLSYSRLSCVYMSDISYSAWLYDAWLPSFCMIACCLSMWAAHISPYLQLSWFRSFLSSWFSLLQVWDLPCACSLTEPEIRSRV